MNSYAGKFTQHQGSCKFVFSRYKISSNTPIERVAVLRPPHMLAGGRGFEPLHTDPESVVLPLDEPPLTPQVYHIQEPLYRAKNPSWINYME